MRKSQFLLAASLLALTACAQSSAGPIGWTRVVGASGQWTHGSGAVRETYRIARVPFGGSLAELGARQTIAVVLGHRGARLLNTRPFPSCPGAGGLAIFVVGNRTLEDAYTALDASAVTILYERPSTSPASAAATAAMTRTICVAPA